MAEKSPDRPVLKAIADIMKDVGAVEKKGRNEFHRYDYATAADVAYALQKRMADAGLIIVPNQTKFELLANNSLLAVEFEFMVEHVSGDKLGDRPKFTGLAAAQNSKGGMDDKAANKCLTAASKYFVLNLFHIPTGDYQDTDAEADRPPAAAGTPVQRGTQESTPFDSMGAADDEINAKTYVDACKGIIRTKTSKDDLERWWKSEGTARRANKLSMEEVEVLKDSVLVRLDEISNSQKEPAASLSDIPPEARVLMAG